MTDKTEDENSSESVGERLAGWLNKLTRTRSSDDLHEALAELIEDQPGEDRADAPEYALLNNIVQLKERTVADCMAPRANIIAVDAAMPFVDLARFVREQGHSRYPVHRGQLDDVIGMIHLKDIMAALVDGRAPKVEDMLRPVLYVPTAMPVMKLLMQMRVRAHNMAIAVDEYGGTDGLITIEDLVEQIVGEIEDEHDETDYAPVQQRGDGALLVDSRMPLDDLARDHADFAALADGDDEIQTINGLILQLAGSVPSRGARLEHPAGFIIDVLDADARRVRRARLRKADAPAD